MAYGQKQYNEIQGIHGKYRINQIGCLVTSFSNLLERFGKPGYDPLKLNAIFRDRGIYIDTDDGVRDDLAWQSVTAVDGSIRSTGRKTGKITTVNAIVKFQISTGYHFCLVADVRDGLNPLVIDSWDGSFKPASSIGKIIDWSGYSHTNAQPVKPLPAPAPKAQAPAPPKAQVDPNFKYIKAEKGFGISHLAKAAGYPSNGPGNFGTPLVWDKIGRANGFVNASQFHVVLGHTYKIPIYKANDYEAPKSTPPVVNPIAEPKADGEQIPVSIVPEAYKQSYIELPQKYRALEDAMIKDLDGLLPDVFLIKGQLVNGQGVFSKGGEQYIRTKHSVEQNVWYGIAEKILEPAEDQDNFDLKLADETRQVLGNFTNREKRMHFFGKVFGFFARFKVNKKEK